MSAKKIFISYSRRDTEYVKSLVEALRKQGFDVWFDKNIRTGTDWDDTIESELKNADAIVLILSKTSVASENVKDEISYAIGLGKPVSPIKIEECDVPMRLARKQFVDFTAMGHEAGFERLVNDLKISLKEAETTVVKGTFKPPETTAAQTNVPAKGSKKILPYIIGGIVTLILFVVLIMQCDDGTTEDVIDNGEEMGTIIDDPEWENALNSNSVDIYLKYIKNAGPEGDYLQDAIDSIYSRLPYEGMTIFMDAEGNRYFSKLFFKDEDGEFDFGVDDNLPPRKFDIITPSAKIDIYDADDKHIIESAQVVAGDKVIVLEVEYHEDNSIWIKIGYSDR